MDRETLGLIWAGNITRWNNRRIQNLNPSLAGLLPDSDIILGYNENSVVSLTEVVKRALVSFSDDFATLFEAANRSFAAMPPALRGTAELAGISTGPRLQWLAVSNVHYKQNAMFRKKCLISEQCLLHRHTLTP